ncbi:MAG: sulfite exporter TauE/SafE family protein [Planctomycetes bacterium]|nr:sulfite exporter TauE/SafE family protein [Planctomycetota bacterium]
MKELVLLLTGFGIGMMGTLLGLGGGFIIVPILLYFYRFQVPRAVGTSHLVISLNAFSGALAYDRQRKIDYRIAMIMAATAIPAALTASLLVHKLGSPWFRVAFACILSIGAFYILKRQDILEGDHAVQRPNSLRNAMIASTISGFAAGILGVGGGIFHVPILCILLGLPIHRATATSHFILLLSSMVAAASLALQGDIDLRIGMWMGTGVIVGAQAGAYFSPKIKDSLLKKGFAVAVIVVAIRMFWDGISLVLKGR